MLYVVAVLQSEDYLIRAAAVLGALAGIGAFAMVVMKATKKTVGGLRGVFMMARNVRLIADQLAPNGGATIKDQLNRIETRQLISDQRQLAMSMDSCEGIFESDPFGGTIRVNRTYGTMVGMDIHGLKGSGWLTCVHHDDRERAHEEWDAAVRDIREFDSVYRMVNRETAVVFAAKVHAYPMTHPDGRLLGFLGTINRVEHSCEATPAAS